jgi:hypothetical protein
MNAPAKTGAGLVNLDRAAAVLYLSGSHRGCVTGDAALACLSRLADFAARQALSKTSSSRPVNERRRFIAASCPATGAALITDRRASVNKTFKDHGGCND